MRCHRNAGWGDIVGGGCWCYLIAVFQYSAFGAFLWLVCFLLLRLFRALAWGQYRWGWAPYIRPTVVVVVWFNRGVLMLRFWCQDGPGVSIIHTKSRHSHRDRYRSLFRLWKCQTNLQKRQEQKCFSDKLWKATRHIVDKCVIYQNTICGIWNGSSQTSS